MKITKLILPLFFISFCLSLNLNAQNYFPVTKQNGLSCVQVLDEDTKIKMINSVMSSDIKADSCFIFSASEYGVKQANLYVKNMKNEVTAIQSWWYNPNKDPKWIDIYWECKFDYNEKSRLSSKEYYYYSTSKTEPQTKSEYKYDDQGNCIEDKQLGGTIESVYNQYNQIIEQTLTAPNTWKKYLYTYNDDGKLEVYEEQYYYSNVSRRSTHIYDNNNYVIEEKHEGLKDGVIDSEKIIRYTNTYQVGKLISSIAVGADGVRLNETEYTYDERGNKTSIINSDFNEAGEEKTPVSRLLTTYDDRDNLIFYERTIWNKEKGDWMAETLNSVSGDEIKQARKEWTYNEDGSVATGKYYISRDNEFELSKNITFYYTPKTPTDIENNLNSDIFVSIENDYLIINSPSSEKISLFSLMGKDVLKTEKSGDRISLSISDLPRGVYIVKGSSGWTRKIKY